MRIVIADPDEQHRQRILAAVRHVAERLGLDVTSYEARDGGAALELCQKYRPQAVLCEIVLEGMSGLALLRRLKRGPEKAPRVAFITELAREADRYWALRCGAYTFVAKPYDDQILRERIERLLASGPDARPESPA